jgi:hypothetical protein
MRYWGPNIKISGNQLYSSNDPQYVSGRTNRGAEDFEVQVQDLLRNIARNPVGKVLLGAINAAPESVTFRALDPEVAAREGPSCAALWTDVAGEGSLGYHGSGSPAFIVLDPHDFFWQGYRYRAIDTLFHESVHALRQMRGRWRPNPGNTSLDAAIRMSFYGNAEEQLAIMLTNIFASVELRNGDMRATHSKNFMPETLSDEEYYHRYHDEILDFRYKMSDLYQPISQLPTGWNPLRIAEKWWDAFHTYSLPEVPAGGPR